MKIIYTLSIAAFVICLPAKKSNAATVVVLVEDNEFNPADFSINAGDTISWMWDNSAGAHTTTSTSIPVAATSWDQPINQGSQIFRYIPAFAGSYNYQCTFHASMGMLGHFTVIGNIGIEEISSGHSIFMNVSTPVTQELRLDYTLQKTTSLNLRLYDVLGNRVSTFVSGTQIAGTYTRTFEISDFAKGVYVLNLETPEATLTRKVIIQ